MTNSKNLPRQQQQKGAMGNALFLEEANRFLQKTTEYIHHGINPGDYYKAIWARDAAYILKDQFLTGDTFNVLKGIYFIWAHQIDSMKDQKIIYGRGSPSTNFSTIEADTKVKSKFQGALPSTIYHHHGFSEVYGLNPDIDSTALMISTTSWILDTYLKAGLYSYYQGLSEWSSEFLPPSPSSPPQSIKPISSADYHDNIKEQFAHHHDHHQQQYNEQDTSLKTISKPTELIDFVIPRMLAAVDYLAARDLDNDGLLEQGYNEDWMDTALRAGKIVYSQACWILALSDLSSLLYEIGDNNTAKKMVEKAERTVYAIEEKLWSKEDATYIDMNYNSYECSSDHNTGSKNNNNQEKILTQDVSLYLVSITENTFNDILSARFKGVCSNEDNLENSTGGSEVTENETKRRQKTIIRSRVPHQTFESRAVSTLETIKSRTWRNSAWPLITEKELKRTGPLILEPNQYHNHTFWPWITGIEMLARSRFQRYDECNELLLTLTKGSHPETLAFYEWVNPTTGKGGGAFPFRTGISAIRIALTDILLSYL